MVESIRETDSGSAETQNTIDANFEKILALKLDRDLLMTKKHERLTKSQAVNELEMSLTSDLKLLCDTGAAVSSEIETLSNLVDEKRNELKKVRMAMDITIDQRLEEMISFENILQKELPKFRDALKIYNEEYLCNEIAEIRKESRDIEDKIVKVNRLIKTLESKYKLTEIGNIETPGDETVTTVLTKLEQLCLESNFDRVSAWKLYQYSNKELKEKISLNKRKLARFT